MKNVQQWFLVPFILAVLLFAETYLPYLSAARNKPDGYIFGGQLTYAPDQNMYFSFISQARDGAFVFKNKLTALPHDPVFVNLEYWLAGFLQRIFHLSEDACYQLWRFLGVVLLALGFGLVATEMLPKPRRTAATAVFLFSGGFGFVFAALSKLGLIGIDTTQNGIVSMRYGMLPLQQAIANPHFSMPHGLILLAYGAYLSAERTHKLSAYILSGCIFTLIGLVRPYDIIPPFLIFPLFVLLTQPQLFANLKRSFIRLSPLFMLLPVLVYNLWLFKYHPIFKYWSLQGHNAGALPAPWWHMAAYGIVGIVAILAFVQRFRQRFSPLVWFCIIWFCATFLFIHLGKVVPALGWSPQIGVYLFVPLTIAAFHFTLSHQLGRFVRGSLIVGFLAILLISHLALLSYYMRARTDDVKREVFYIPAQQMQLMQWMKQQLPPASVVLADVTTSQRIAKYTTSSVVAAHYSVTPRFAHYAALAERTLADTSITNGSLPMPIANVEYIMLKETNGAYTGRLPIVNRVGPYILLKVNNSN